MYRKEFQRWATNTNERQKLQWTYAAVAVVGLLAAGLVGLVDMSLARNILQIVTVAAGLFIANFIVWALIRAFIDDIDEAPRGITPITPDKPARLIRKK